MKAKLIPILATLLALFSLAGCNTPQVVNMTVPQIPQNPSGIYTLSCNARITDGQMAANSLRAYVMVEGAEREMKRSPYGDQIFEYDYLMPSDRAVAKYYFILRYTATVNSLPVAREIHGPLNTLNVVNRYVLTLESTRGPVGSAITVVGRGFQKADVVVIGGQETATTYLSPNSLTFIVPALPAKRDYMVELHAGTNVFPMGLFRVDPTDFTVTPSALEMASGDVQQLVVGIPLNAPPGGLPIDALTDVPASLIMPEFGIQAGQKTISVKVQAGTPGKGGLHITAPGFNEVVIPVIVIPKGDSGPAPVAPTPAAPTPPPPAAPIIMGS